MTAFLRLKAQRQSPAVRPENVPRGFRRFEDGIPG